MDTPTAGLAIAKGAGHGVVTSSPTGIDCGMTRSVVYAVPTQATLTATPKKGSYFAGWSEPTARRARTTAQAQLPSPLTGTPDVERR